LEIETELSQPLEIVTELESDWHREADAACEARKLALETTQESDQLMQK